MKQIRGLCKGVQAFLLFIIPIILLYWFLSLIKLDALKPLTAVFGVVLDPFVMMVRSIISYELNYNDIKVDFTHLIGVGFIVIIYIILEFINNSINLMEESCRKTKEKIKQAEQIKQQNLIRKTYLEALAQNKIVYLVLKLKTNETSAAYLCNKENDIFSEGITNTVINNILESSEKYDSKKYKDFKGPDDSYNFIFYNIADAIDYSLYIYNKIIEANRNIIDPSIRLFFKIACHCSSTEESATTDLRITNKLMNLCGEYEIMTTELFKEKYDALEHETNLTFVSKGIYCIDDKQMETYQLKAFRPRV
jgi:hypothetical protein